MLRFHFFSTCVLLALHTCLLRMLRLPSSSCSTCIQRMFSSFHTHVDHAFTLSITCVLHMSFTIYTVDVTFHFLSNMHSPCFIRMFSSFLMHVDHAFTLLITCVLHMPFTIYTVDRYLVTVVYSLTIHFLLKTLGSNQRDY